MAINPKQESPFILEYFSRLFGADFSQNAQIQKWLTPSGLKMFSMGETLTTQSFEVGYLGILLQGRLRALGKVHQSAKPKTLMTFQPGAVWDGNFLLQEDLELKISSEEAMLYMMPLDVAEKIPALLSHFKELKLRMAEAKETQRSVVETDENPVNSSDTDSSHQGINLPPLPPRRKAQEQFSEDAWDCLTEINTYYLQKPMSGRRITDPRAMRHKKIRNMHEFQKQLEFMQFKIKTHHLNWQQLLNAPYPLIVQDHDYTLHWITGRQGNNLLEAKKGQQCRFFQNQENEAVNVTYEVLTLLPFRKKASVSFKNAFTSAWYFKLCTDNVLMSSQMVLVSILVQVFSLSMPLFYMVIFDKVFGHQNLSTLNVMAVGIIGIMVFDLIIKQIRSHVMSYFLEHLDRISFESLAKCIFHLPLEKANAYLNRGLAERFMEVSSVNQTVITTFLITSMDVVFSVIILLFLLSLNVQMALISVAPLIPIGFMYFWKAPRDKKKRHSTL